MQQCRSIIALILFIFTFSTLANAQLVEDFNTGNKTSYSGASVTLSSGDWFFNDALLGSLSNDKFNGSQGVRLDRRTGKQGNIYMLFDKQNGADEITFSIANYGNTTGNGVQVQYSTNSGFSWVNVGDPVQASSTLEVTTLPVQVSGNIRFKFVQSGAERMNLDDLTITDYIEAQDSATIALTVDGVVAEDQGLIEFPKTLIGTTNEKTIQIKNVGNTKLSISDISLSGAGYSLTSFSSDSLAFNESISLTLTYEPTAAELAQGLLTITSNDANGETLSLFISGEGFADGDIIPISEARKLPLGTRVSISGRVTVANELGGPLYLQDGTAGIAVYWEPLHIASQIGDSVSVTGPLSVFRPIAGSDADFLLQISGSASDNILYEVFDVEAKLVTPTPVNLSQLNSGNYEGQLVIVQNATINHTGAFGSNQNYEISDNSDVAELRIDNNTNLVNAIAPTGETNVVGAVGKFGGIYQLIPRFTSDLGVEAIVYPGDSVSKDVTLDVVTWNVEWFGDAGNGPEDDNIQFENVKTLITTMDADIYALQEIANTSLFNDLDTDLTEYSGVIANYSQSQKTAFLFKNSTISVKNSGLITSGMTQSDWANGRYPLMLQFEATINGEVQEFYAYNIHAKAFGEASDYAQRLNASSQLKTYLDANRASDNVIVLGDFNDEILESTNEGSESPYKNFDDDVEYTIVTKNLEEKGYTSYSRFSMIDHIVFTSELDDEYFEGTERIENPFYIGSFLSETSDHFPVWVRFQWGTPTSSEIDRNEVVTKLRLDQNYPNPFNPSTTISYSLTNSSNVRLEVFDLMGRKVATLINGRQQAGEQTVQFDASNLASGIYIYRLDTGSQLLTKKMILLK